MQDSGDSILFSFVNAGKDILTLDLKTQQGAESLWEILSEADVFITNFRGAGLSRLGIDSRTLHEAFPGLVIGWITGTYLDTDASPAVDITALARSGFLMLDRLDESLQRPNVPIVDLMAGMFLAIEVLACMSSPSGRGREIRVPLQDSAFFLNSLAMAASPTFYRDERPPRNTSAFGLSLVAEASDGWVGIAAPSDALFTKFATALKREDWLSRFPTADDRRVRAAELVEDIRREIGGRRAEEVVRELRQLDVPCEIVRTSVEASTDPYLIESGLVREGEQEGLVSVLPLSVDGRRMRLDGGTGEDAR